MLRSLVVLACLSWWLSSDAHSQALPDWQLEGLQPSAPLALTDYQDGWLLLDFWASWCGPCRETFPAHDRLLDAFPGLRILAISLDLDREQAKEFLQHYPVRFDVAWAGDSHNALLDRFQVLGMPSAYLFNPDGELLKTYQGLASKNELADDLGYWFPDSDH